MICVNRKGKILVLQRFLVVKKTSEILQFYQDGVCEGHFFQEINNMKILQARLSWPSMHRDVQKWFKSCRACQGIGNPKPLYGTRVIMGSCGPFEKWNIIDAMGTLPCISLDIECNTIEWTT